MLLRWPCFVYDPEMVGSALKAKVLKNLGKKHIVYYYGSDNYDFASPNQLRPFEEFLIECENQKITKGYTKQYNDGLELAKSDLLLNSMERVIWKHPNRGRRGEKRKKESSKKPVKKNTNISSGDSDKASTDDNSSSKVRSVII